MSAEHYDWMKVPVDGHIAPVIRPPLSLIRSSWPTWTRNTLLTQLRDFDGAALRESRDRIFRSPRGQSDLRFRKPFCRQYQQLKTRVLQIRCVGGQRQIRVHLFWLIWKSGMSGRDSQLLSPTSKNGIKINVFWTTRKAVYLLSGNMFSQSADNSRSSSRSLKRWTLPVAVRGKSLRSSIQRGYFHGPACSLT
jgi:hypothetical protein